VAATVRPGRLWKCDGPAQIGRGACFSVVSGERQHRPWRVLISVEFLSESAAARFEQYLKSGFGRACARRHFGAG
jgi:hypothetical protein